MSNFPLRYKLSWLPRLLRPAPVGARRGFLPATAALMSPQPAATKRLVFLGDISAVANRAPPEIDDRLRALIASADLVIGNCESPVVERPRTPFATAAGTRHAMTAGFLSATIVAAGIARDRLLLSLANNHMLDQGVAGFAETQDALAGMGIATVGGAEGGRIVRIGDLSIGIAAFTQWRNASLEEFRGRVTMLDDFERDDFAVLETLQADLRCVVAHWDWEFRHMPSKATRTTARQLSGRGVQLVVGHHAHVLQPVERIGETIVAYGIGDFLGTVLPRQPWPGRLGAIFVADVSAEPASKGRIAAYSAVPFVRLRLRDHERLVALHEAQGRLRVLADVRFAQLFPLTGATG